MRAKLEKWLLSLWYRTHAPWGWLVALYPLTLITKRISRGRRARIRARKLARRHERHAAGVVVVGNLIAGGAGKTPICLALAEAMTDRGWQVGLIARGDGAATAIDAPRLIDPENPNAAADGDEATLLARRSGLPVAVGRNRAGAAALLMAQHPGINLIISDDGLQHEALERDVELVVFDARGMGNGHLLPLGPLREPVESLQYTDALIANEICEPDGESLTRATPRFTSRLRITEIIPLHWHRTRPASVAETGAAERLDIPDALLGKTIAALAGISSPERFFEALRGLGLSVNGYSPGDHRTPDRAWWKRLRESAIIMTEKDAVKCTASEIDHLYVACARAEIDRALPDWLDETLRGSTIA